MTLLRQNFGGMDQPFVKGDHKLITVEATKSVPGPLTLTSKRWKASLDGQIVISKEGSAISFTDIDDESFRLEFELMPADTINLSASPYYEHELEIVDQAGKTTTILKGFFKLTDHIVV